MTNIKALNMTHKNKLTCKFLFLLFKFLVVSLDRFLDSNIRIDQKITLDILGRFIKVNVYKYLK